MPTLLLTSPRYLDHDMGPGHPERPERIEAILERLDRAALDGVARCEPSPAPLEAIAANHDPEYVDRVRQLSQEGTPVALTPDTVVSPATFEAAVLASGASLAAVDAVMAGSAGNAFSLHRPPGHHAEAGQGMGFCFYNHVAIAARHLRSHHRVERVAIVDWDVHHGNGTQSSFYDDGSVFFFSVHQYPHYPGTGRADETGAGAGTGTTLNVPLAGGHGDDDYLGILDEQLRPALERFEPEFLLLSAGFDAHGADPLGGMKLTADGFGDLTRKVAVMAHDLCGGRLVSLLEGGYDLEATASSVEAHLSVLSAECG